jgi:hypothetical protein
MLVHVVEMSILNWREARWMHALAKWGKVHRWISRYIFFVPGEPPTLRRIGELYHFWGEHGYPSKLGKRLTLAFGIERACL